MDNVLGLYARALRQADATSPRTRRRFSAALLGGAAPAAARSSESDGRFLAHCPLIRDADDRPLLGSDGAAFTGAVGAVDIAFFAAAEA